jgi:hypothetical protein
MLSNKNLPCAPEDADTYTVSLFQNIPNQEMIDGTATFNEHFCFKSEDDHDTDMWWDDENECMDATIVFDKNEQCQLNPVNNAMRHMYSVIESLRHENELALRNVPVGVEPDTMLRFMTRTDISFTTRFVARYGNLKVDYTFSTNPVDYELEE